eukprot:5028-Prymnesium_polylepis.1
MCACGACNAAVRAAQCEQHRRRVQRSVRAWRGVCARPPCASGTTTSERGDSWEPLHASLADGPSGDVAKANASDPAEEAPDDDLNDEPCSRLERSAQRTSSRSREPRGRCSPPRASDCFRRPATPSHERRLCRAGPGGGSARAPRAPPRALASATARRDIDSSSCWASPGAAPPHPPQ